MKWLGVSHVILRVITGALCVSMLACASPIVGGECKDGYVVCGGRCVRLDDNFMHCGACDNECSALQVCSAGHCILNTDVDGGDIDGGGSGGTGGGGTGGGGSGGVGGIVIPPDAGFPGCELGEAECSGTCVLLKNDPDNCGDCGNECTIGQFCVEGLCVDACEDPLTFCPANEHCVDLQTDPRNCGACGRKCMSGLCEAGMCQDAVPGHLIVIGHDYAISNVSMELLLRSSVFLAPGAPVAAITYQGNASDAAVARINALIEASLERDWAPQSVSTDLELGIRLNDPASRLIVIYPQAGESDANLRKFGETHLHRLADFLRRGRVVVLFEHDPNDVNGGSRNAGTHQMLGCRGLPEPCTPLFSADSVSRVAVGTRVLIDHDDGISTGIPDAYAATRNTMAFSGFATPGRIVATEEPSGMPVIVHRLVSAVAEP